MDKQTKAYSDAHACAQSLRAMLPATALGPRSMQIVGAQINNELAVIAASVECLYNAALRAPLTAGEEECQPDAASAIERIAALVAALTGAS